MQAKAGEVGREILISQLREAKANAERESAAAHETLEAKVKELEDHIARQQETIEEGNDKQKQMVAEAEESRRHGEELVKELEGAKHGEEGAREELKTLKAKLDEVCCRDDAWVLLAAYHASLLDRGSKGRQLGRR